MAEGGPQRRAARSSGAAASYSDLTKSAVLLMRDGSIDRSDCAASRICWRLYARRGAIGANWRVRANALPAK